MLFAYAVCMWLFACGCLYGVCTVFTCCCTCCFVVSADAVIILCAWKCVCVCVCVCACVCGCLCVYVCGCMFRKRQISSIKLLQKWSSKEYHVMCVIVTPHYLQQLWRVSVHMNVWEWVSVYFQVFVLCAFHVFCTKHTSIHNNRHCQNTLQLSVRNFLEMSNNYKYTIWETSPEILVGMYIHMRTHVLMNTPIHKWPHIHSLTRTHTTHMYERIHTQACTWNVVSILAFAICSTDCFTLYGCNDNYSSANVLFKSKFAAESIFKMIF